MQLRASEDPDNWAPAFAGEVLGAGYGLAPDHFQRYLTCMTDDKKPLSPFTLTPPRILLLVLGALALTFIIGAITGGVANYDLLKQARNEALSSLVLTPSE